MYLLTESVPFKKPSLKSHTTVSFTFHAEFSWIYSQSPIIGILLVRKWGKWLIGSQTRICYDKIHILSTLEINDISFGSIISLPTQGS